MEPALTATVTVEDWSPSSRSSSTPVTVTVWVSSQLAVVNVNVIGETIASPMSDAETSNTTSPVGSESNTTVKVSAEPASVTDAVVSDRENPAVSSSTVVTDTVWSAVPSNSSADDASATATVSEMARSPSSTSSLKAVAVTVWGVAQFAAVKVSVAGEVPLTRASVVSEDVTVTTTSEVGW